MTNSNTLPFTAIVDTVDLFTKSIVLRSGDIAKVRPVQPNDQIRLGRYFEDLSDETRSRYGPHKFSMAVAEEICSQVGHDETVRMVAVTGHGATAEIVAYFILDFAIPDSERARYQGYGITLHTESDCRLAPSVADRYQNSGVGSALMPKCKEVVRQFGYQRMILMGGVLVRNPLAVHFYQKHGFRKVGDFEQGTKNASYDMILSLD